MNREPQFIQSRQRLVNISCFFIWVGSSLIQTGILIWNDFSRDMAINDSLISSTILTIACFIISNALNFYLPSQRHYFYVVIWALVLAGADISLSRWIQQYVITDAEHLQSIDHSLPIRFFFHFMLIGWMATVNILWNIQQDYKENEQRKTDAEKLAREAELYNLRQQLQPHFLFNSLNSIIALIGRKPQEAREMTFQLSDFLRGTLRKDDQQFIALREEFDHLRLYLEIEKVRFGHRLDTQITTDEIADESVLPAMIVQPLVENAIKFGLYDTTGMVTITICARFNQEDNMLEIRIQNPYDISKSVAKKKGTGFGLRGVQRRLFLLFGRTDLLETQATEDIFTSIIKIPQP